MSFPGPPSGLWVLTLICFGISISVVGETVRWGLAHWSSFLRAPEPIERILVDLFLGGAVFYVVGSIPFGLFYPLTPAVILVLGAVAFVLLVVRVRRTDAPEFVEQFFRTLLRLPYLLVFGAAFALLFLEVVVANQIGTGNSFDSSLLTIYVSLLLQHHALPLSFEPVAAEGLLYPQGATAWFAVPQLLFTIPPARTSLLVTPLFWGLVPLSAFVWGRRWIGTERAGVAFALMFAFVGSWTRVLVGGSNDFVLAFPLVLLLVGWSIEWMRAPVPGWGDALAFGALAGYSAAINPVGAQVLFVLLPVSALFVIPRFAGETSRWFARWAAAIGVALAFVLPTLYVLAQGHGSYGYVPGAPSPPSGASSGLSFAQFLGAIDPFLFRSGDQMLSPLPLLRAELAVLLIVGALLVFVPLWSPPKDFPIRTLRIFFAAGVVVLVGFLSIELAAAYHLPAAQAVAYLTSGAEVSILLFVWMTALATVPLVLLFQSLRELPPLRGPAESPSQAAYSNEGRARGPQRAPGQAQVFVALGVSALLLVPGIALTGVSLPGDLHEIYQALGNTTAADFDLLAYAQTHVPSGSRVLVAPGSAAQFLPGYVAGIVLLYPLVPGWMWLNQSYNLLRTELSNGTLSSAGFAAIASLQVDYVAVTGNTTVLWPPFSPVPLLSSSEFTLLFHENDAYLFAVTLPPAVSR